LQLRMPVIAIRIGERGQSTSRDECLLNRARELDLYVMKALSPREPSVQIARGNSSCKKREKRIFGALEGKRETETYSGNQPCDIVEKRVERAQEKGRNGFHASRGPGKKQTA